jgi:hypothetical protein
LSAFIDDVKATFMIPIRTAAFILIFLAVASAPFAVALPDEDTRADVYQIIHAGPDRVWRLNKKTGEVTVCTLENDHLVCVPGVEAPKSQTPTFDQIEAERARAAAESEQRRKEENAKRMAVLDRMIAAFRQFIHAAIEADNGEAGK